MGAYGNELKSNKTKIIINQTKLHLKKTMVVLS
jgi:hypothetical protein